MIREFDSIHDLDDVDLRRMSPAQAAYLVRRLAALRSLEALLHADGCSCDACRVRQQGEARVRRQIAAGLRGRLARAGRPS